MDIQRQERGKQRGTRKRQNKEEIEEWKLEKVKDQRFGGRQKQK